MKRAILLLLFAGGGGMWAVRSQLDQSPLESRPEINLAAASLVPTLLAPEEAANYEQRFATMDVDAEPVPDAEAADVTDADAQPESAIMQDARAEGPVAVDSDASQAQHLSDVEPTTEAASFSSPLVASETQPSEPDFTSASSMLELHLRDLHHRLGAADER